jgi:hypothetical protein
MPRGDKSSYTDKQKRQAEHIEEGYEDRGLGKHVAERRAWATVKNRRWQQKRFRPRRDRAPRRKPRRHASEPQRSRAHAGNNLSGNPLLTVGAVF